MTTPISKSTPENRSKSGQFKPGQSGNPGGRPKTAALNEEIREFLNGKQGSKTRLQIVLKRLMKTKPEILLYYYGGKPAENIGVKLEMVAGVPNEVVEELSRRFCSKAGFAVNGHN